MGFIAKHKQAMKSEYIAVYDAIVMICEEHANEDLSPADYQYFLNKSGFIDAMNGHYYEEESNLFTFYLPGSHHLEKFKSQYDYMLDFHICDIIINVNHHSNDCPKTVAEAKKFYWKRDYFLEPVQNLLSRIARKAKCMNCKLVLSSRSQFFHSLLFFSSQAKLRSTTQRWGMTLKVCN